MKLDIIIKSPNFTVLEKKNIFTTETVEVRKNKDIASLSSVS